VTISIRAENRNYTLAATPYLMSSLPTENEEGGIYKAAKEKTGKESERGGVKGREGDQGMRREWRGRKRRKRRGNEIRERRGKKEG
jgi:hypothetical protein